ncbi:unnamed protein product, partial [Arctogadus glacialis]
RSDSGGTMVPTSHVHAQRARHQGAELCITTTSNSLPTLNTTSPTTTTTSTTNTAIAQFPLKGMPDCAVLEPPRPQLPLSDVHSTQDGLPIDRRALPGWEQGSGGRCCGGSYRLCGVKSAFV